MGKESSSKVSSPDPSAAGAAADGQGLSAPVRARTVSFPPDRSVGTLFQRNEGDLSDSGWEKIGEAQGERALSAGKELRLKLKVGDDAPTGLSFLRRLNPNDLQSLRLEYTKVTDADLSCLE